MLCRLGLRLLRGVRGPRQFQAGDIGQVLFLGERAVDLGTLHAREVVRAVLRGDAVAEQGPGGLVGRGPPAAQFALGVDQRALGIDRAGQLVADQATEAAELVGSVGLGVEHRPLQDRSGDDQAVLRQIVGQRRLLRQHVPAAVGVALADALHFLAMAPGRRDQHVAAERAAAHRLHAVVQVAQRGADLDLQRGQLGLRFGLGFGTHPAAVLDRFDLYFAHLVDDPRRLATVFGRQVTGGVFATEHRAGGHVDRLQHVFPALRRQGFATQHAAAEFEFGVAVGLGQVRRHRVAHAPAQVGLPLVRLELGDHAVELLEQARVGQRDQIVIHALGLQEGIQLQVAVAAVELLGGDRRVVVERVVDAGQRLRVARQFGFQCDHRLRLGIQLGGRSAGQCQDLLDVIAVAAHQRNGVGVGAGIERRVRQAHAALHEVTDVAVQRLQVHVRAEVEGHRDADLVQRGDRGRHILGLLDRVDAGQQRGDRIGSVGFHGGFVQAAGPEVAQQFLHVALRRLHRCVEQFTLLLTAAVDQLAQRGGGTGLWHRVGLQPACVGGVIEVAALGADGRGARGLLLGGGERIMGRDQGRQADAQGDGKRTEIGHVERIRDGLRARAL